jgi:hypothetical protein
MFETVCEITELGRLAVAVLYPLQAESLFLTPEVRLEPG